MYKTDKMDENVVTTLKTLNNEARDISNKVGELWLREKELKRALVEITDQLESWEKKHQGKIGEINITLEDLKQKYKSGTIDLETGTITYIEESEN